MLLCDFISIGYIEISYVDRTGYSIVIENTSILGHSTVNMTGWSLRKTIDNKFTNDYKFPDNFIVKSIVYQFVLLLVIQLSEK